MFGHKSIHVFVNTRTESDWYRNCGQTLSGNDNDGSGKLKMTSFFVWAIFIVGRNMMNHGLRGL